MCLKVELLKVIERVTSEVFVFGEFMTNCFGEKRVGRYMGGNGDSMRAFGGSFLEKYQGSMVIRWGGI